MLILQKTEYLFVGEQMNGIMLDCGVIKHYHQYNYLGSIINQDGTCDKDINCGLTQGRIAILKPISLLWSSQTGMDVELNLYRANLE